MIIIPQPSKDCNEKWDYLNRGNNWECQCTEGKEQSPIDLPSLEKSISSAVKPLFLYEEFDPVAEISSSDGLIKAGKRIRINYLNNAIK